MKRLIKSCLLIIVALAAIQATCGKITKPIPKTAVRAIRFKDFVYFHNVSIAYDGNHFFAINGGNENYCKLNEYDKKGNLIKSYDVGLDARAIFYNSETKKLYVKIFGYDLYSINLSDESADLELSFVFESDNSSPAASPDGKYIYELHEGELRTLEFKTGKEVKSFEISDYFYEHSFNASIAASDGYIFVWASEDDLYAYDFEGNYVTKIELPAQGFGFSLSYCNNLIWIALDADGSVDGEFGFWYGYDLDGRYTTRSKATGEKGLDTATPK